jgi:hypothetical protein
MLPLFLDNCRAISHAATFIPYLLVAAALPIKTACFGFALRKYKVLQMLIIGRKQLMILSNLYNYKKYLPHKPQ